MFPSLLSSVCHAFNPLLINNYLTTSSNSNTNKQKTYDPAYTEGAFTLDLFQVWGQRVVEGC